MEQDWANFAVITGSSAGALTGLLFLAVSLNRERIARHAPLRAQAGQTLVLFMLPLLLSLLIVVPERSATAFGSWLIVLAVLAGLTLTAIGRGKEPVGDDSEAALARLIDRVSPNLLVLLLILVAAAWNSPAMTAFTGPPRPARCPWSAASSTPGCSWCAEQPRPVRASTPQAHWPAPHDQPAKNRLCDAVA